MRLLGKRGKRNEATAPAPAPRAKPTREAVADDMVLLAGGDGQAWHVVAVVWYGRERYLRLERSGVEGWREVPATRCELGPEAGGLWEERAG